MAVPDQCPCPVCGRSSNRMESLSKASAYIDYYRCEECRHIWTVPKGECEPADDVTTKSA